MTETKTVGIVLPVLDEGENATRVLEAIDAVFRDRPERHEIVFVNDGSKAETRKVLDDLAIAHAHVRVLHLSRNFGHQAALTAGLDHSDADAVVLMDADLQHPPSEIPRMLDAWHAGIMVVNMVREEEADVPFAKRLTSRGYYRLFNALSDTRIECGAADFRLIDRKVVLALRGLRERARFLRGLTAWLGFPQAHLNFRAPARKHGQTQFTFRRMLALAFDGITSMSTVPLRISLATGLVVSSLSGLYIIYIFFAYAFTNRAIVGWSSLIVATLFMGGVQLVMLGVLGQYVGRLYEEAKQRPIYLVESTTGRTGQERPEQP